MGTVILLGVLADQRFASRRKIPTARASAGDGRALGPKKAGVIRAL